MGELPFAFDRASNQELRRDAEERRASSDRAESTNGHARFAWAPKCSGSGGDGPTKSKRIDTYRPRATLRWERFQRGRHAQLQRSEVDVWIGRFEVQAGR